MILYNGNSLEVLKNIENNSIDAIVSDPPYELGFMGKKWDSTGIAYNVELWKECLRVLKSGGHLLAFGGTRTYHRMAVAIEDAGFEVRDMLEWIYASGFPKSLNIGKAVDKLQGNEREVVGSKSSDDIRGGNMMNQETRRIITHTTKGNSEWEGFGTALKPAHEPIIMARKPLSEKTIVENVLKYGTGALDIDGCRIPTNETPKGSGNADKSGTEQKWGFIGNGGNETSPLGRFPANIICTDDALNDGVMTKSGVILEHHNKSELYGRNCFTKSKTTSNGERGFGDSGSKSRYFDIDVWGEKHGLLQFPKASKRERNDGCEGLEVKNLAGGNKWTDVDYRKGDGNITAQPQHNHHPTVKPVHLMSWLIRLVSKEGDTVLDPFMGSGTTGVASRILNRHFVGIELSEEYFEIAKARINKPKDSLF